MVEPMRKIAMVWLAIFLGESPLITRSFVVRHPMARRAVSPKMASSSSNLSNLTVAQLKDLLREQGKPVSGRKAELIERLTGMSQPTGMEDVADVPLPGARSVLISACKS